MHRAKKRGSLRQDYGQQRRKDLKSFSDAVEVYRECRGREVAQGERSASGWEVEQHVLRMLERYFGDRLLIEIRTPDIEAFAFARRRNDGVKGATVNRNLAALSKIFDLAKRHGWVDSNPVKEVKRSPESSDAWRWLHQEEAELLLEACRHPDAPEYLYPLVLSALYTGMRRGELLNLEWRSVDLIRGQIEITVSKTGRRRTVPLRPEVVDVLGRWRGRAQGPEVFAVRDIRTPFATALKRSKIRKIRFHDLRHTAASWMAQNGVDLLQIKEVLGHTTITTTQRYAHLVQRNAEHAVGQMPALEVEKPATRTATPADPGGNVVQVDFAETPANISTEGGTRTLTSVSSLDFESTASVG